MQTPEECRAQAAECMRRAEYAKSATHRMILLDMAQTWLRMADDGERTNKMLSDEWPIGLRQSGPSGNAQ
jgi:hypothetical protein